MEFTETERGKPKIIKDGYIYTFKKELASGLRTFECVLRRKESQCHAFIRVDENDDFVEQVNEHTHAPSPTEAKVSKLKVSMKRRALTTVDNPHQILTRELRNVTDDVAANLPSMETLRRNIRKARENGDQPPNPISREDIPVLPQAYSQTTVNERFLIYDSGVGDENRIFIFASDIGVQLLGESEHWYADGTFKVCPEIFFQLYTIHAQRDKQIFPCLYALLPNKTEATYRRFFDQVFQGVPNENLQDFLVDFEKGAMNAIEHFKPDTEIKGCFYHLSSNVWKKVRELGFQQRYVNEEEFALHCRMLCALAFLPEADVIDGFNELTDVVQENFEHDFDGLLNYFEDTYIGRVRRNRRGRPLFPINTWNMFNRTNDELPRTNNNVEGWHRRFSLQVSSCHPTIWKFIDLLKEEENFVRVEIVQQLVGHAPQAQRRRYRDCNQRILTIVEDYQNRDRIQYLRAIAHNIAFQLFELGFNFLCTW